MSFDGFVVPSAEQTVPDDFDSLIHCCVDIGGVVVMFDVEDWRRLSQFKVLVSTDNHGYAMVGGWAKGERLLHRLIMSAPKGMVVDHRNHNRLDNRRINLRIVHPTLNNHNSWRAKPAGERGVRFRKNGWEASLGFRYTKSFLGRFSNKEDALRAYDRRAVECFGADACTNYPIDEYEMPDARLVDSLPIQPTKHNRERKVCIECGLRRGIGKDCLCTVCGNKRGRRVEAALEGREVTKYAERVKAKSSCCTHPGCERTDVFARNLCEPHWREQRKAEGEYKRGPKKEYFCTIPGCDKVRYQHKEGLCKAHWNEKHGVTTVRTGRPPKQKVPCTIAGCGRSDASPSHGLCPEHYRIEYFKKNPEKRQAKVVRRSASINGATNMEVSDD